MSKYHITIKGKEYEVEVGDLSSSPVTVTVDGVDHQVELPEGASPARQPAITPPAAPRPASKPAPVAPPRPSVPTSGDDGSIRALMPGRIISVSVSAGDSITAGQAVLVMESMKMENTIAAPQAGTVRAVMVAEGDSVQHGQTLIEIE